MGQLVVEPVIEGYAGGVVYSPDYSWHDIMSSGGNAGDHTQAISLVRWTSESVEDTWSGAYRGFMGFDTSTLPVGCVITSATLTLRYYDKKNDLTGSTPAIAVVEATLASHAAVGMADYGTAGTDLLSDSIAYAAWTSGDRTFTFNAAGLAYINKTGYTDISICEVNYDIADRLDPNNHDPNWVASKVMYMRWVGTGDAPKPYLTVNYESAPTCTSATPDSAKREETKDIILAGSGLTGSTDVDFGANIAVNSYSVDSDIQITANITIAAEAALGARDVVVTAPYGVATLTAGFTVETATPITGSGIGAYFARRIARIGF